MIRHLTTDEVLGIHRALTDEFQDSDDPIVPPGVKDFGMLDSAVARPQTGFSGSEKYPTVEAKAGALLHSLVKNHAFHNGNKRTAFVSVVVFLYENGRRISSGVSDDALLDFIVGIASGNDEDVERIARWIKENTESRHATFSDMNIYEFLGKISLSGGTYQRRKGSYIVWGPNGDSVNISESTRRLASGVVMKYASKLGLNTAGYDRDEFQDGINPAQTAIRRYRAMIGRLAHL